MKPDTALRLPTPDGSGQRRDQAVPQPANLDLLRGMELEITLRFGQRQMPLREILELGPGSVVELDRQVDEPVELLVGGKVIGHGEVVVAGGGYGLRVTAIASLQQRRETFVR